MGDAPGPAAWQRSVALALAVAFVGVLVAVRLLGAGEPQQGASPAPGEERQASAAPEVVRAAEPEAASVPDDLLGGIRFVDVTRRVGLSGNGPAVPGPTAADMDAGAAVTDLDDDGDLDLLLTSAGRASGLFLNEGGTFADITRRSGIGGLETATVPAFADVDADGDLDLFVGGRGKEFGRLLVNDGTLRFTDRSQALGVVPHGRGGQRAIRGADFGDIDRDGDLDLLVTDWNIGSFLAVEAAKGDDSDRVPGQCAYAAAVRRLHASGSLEVTGETRLFRNDGGRFADATEDWGLADLGIERPFTPQLVDLDADGWLDLAVAGDSCSSRLFHNEGGRRFADVTRQASVGTDENGMGSLIHDIDGDGRPDWLVTSIAFPTADGECPEVSVFAGCSGNRLYLNRGRMRFEDATDELALRNTGWGWGVVAADFANDGRTQVAVTNGRVGSSTAIDPADQAQVYYETFASDPTAFLVRAADGRFVDVAGQVGIRDDDVAHALVAFDHDRDGRLDLLVATAGSAPHLYRNVTTPLRRWTGIRLRDPRTPGNRSGLGSRIEVTSTSGATTTRWMHTSGSYEAQLPAEVHVGLGEHGVRRIRVWWPGETEPQVVERVAVDRVITITRTAGRS